jgi:hypothetical protein
LDALLNEYADAVIRGSIASSVANYARRAKTKCARSLARIPATVAARDTPGRTTGLDAAEVREQVEGYQERYDVPTESLR